MVGGATALCSGMELTAADVDDAELDAVLLAEGAAANSEDVAGADDKAVGPDSAKLPVLQAASSTVTPKPAAAKADVPRRLNDVRRPHCIGDLMTPPRYGCRALPGPPGRLLAPCRRTERLAGTRASRLGLAMVAARLPAPGPPPARRHKLTG